jgi:hypothetical protein
VLVLKGVGVGWTTIKSTIFLHFKWIYVLIIEVREEYS